MLLGVLRFASNTVSRLASADLGRRVTIWDITMEQERADNKLTETLVVCFAFTDPDGKWLQGYSVHLVADCDL